MSHNLRKCMQDLALVSQYKRPTRDVILKFLAHKKCIWDALREIAVNIKKIKLSKSQKRKLNRHSKTIKAIAKGTKNKRKRKELVQQTGGFLNVLIPALAAALPAVIDLIK